MNSSAVSQRRYDPERRSRIIDVCLDVIAEVGLAGEYPIGALPLRSTFHSVR